MSGYLLNVGVSAMCGHGASMAINPGSTRVKVDGQPAATEADMAMISGCPHMMGNVPSPCLMVDFMVPATRVKIEGKAALLDTSTNQCKSPAQAPQGPVSFMQVQAKAKGA